MQGVSPPTPVKGRAVPEVQETTPPTPRRDWLGTELVFLRQNYVAKGAPWCASQLNRTVGAVRGMAKKHKIVRPADEIRFRWTPQHDERLRRVYENGKVGAVTALAHSLGITPSQVRYRAGELGLSTRWQTGPWTEPEIEFVEAHTHLRRSTISLLMGKKGWRRTSVAVAKLIRSRGLVGANDRFLPASTVAACLGVAPMVVFKWLKSGLLSSESPTGGEQDGRPVYLIENRELARFIVQNPLKLDPRKFDWPWVSDLLARYGSFGLIDGRTMIERVAALDREKRSPREIAEILESTPNSVSVMLSRIRAQERRQAA